MDTIADAIAELKRVMREDPEYAWGWHCNLAVPIMDVTGVSHIRANQTAAYLMRVLFDHDITDNHHYCYGKDAAHEYYEMRVEADRDQS